MITRIILFFSVLLILFSSTATTGYGQKLPKLPKDPARALAVADQHFADRQFTEALRDYNRVLATFTYEDEADECHINYRIGRCLYYLARFNEAIEQYKACFDDGCKNDTLYFSYAEVLKEVGQYKKAKTNFLTFYDKVTDKNTGFAKFSMQLANNCDLARELENKAPEYIVSKEKLTFNSDEGSDFASRVAVIKSDSFLIFTSNRVGNEGKPDHIYGHMGEVYSDIWIVSIKEGEYGEPENLGKRPNTKANDGSACLAPDGKTLYYTICGGGKHKKYHGCSIYSSEFDPDKSTWSKFKKVEGINGKTTVVVNSKGKEKKVPTYCAQPFVFINPSGEEMMYFTSDRPGGEGETDIWYSTKNGDGSWGKPQNCGSDINSPASESYPFVNSAGDVLFFSSDGHHGIGGYDIFKAEGNEEVWGEVINMGYPINTSYNDFGIFWTVDDSAGYLTSNRIPEGEDIEKAYYNIYEIVAIPKPKCKLVVEGSVRNRNDRSPIAFATVQLFRINSNSSKTEIQSYSTTNDGKYSFKLDMDYAYQLIGTADGYNPGENTVPFMEIDCDAIDVDHCPPGISCSEVEDTMILTLNKPIDILLDGPVPEVFVLQNIYYDFDKSALRPESITELDKLVVYMNDNPTMTIRVGSHTDTNGSEKYNIGLSNRRAKAVVDYLVSQGIFTARMDAFGYGESQPWRYPELTDSDEQDNRRSEFRIKSFDYIPDATEEDAGAGSND